MSDHSRIQGIPGLAATDFNSLVRGADTEVGALASVTAAAGAVPYFTSTTAASTFPITSFGRSLVAKSAAVGVTGSKGSNAALTSLIAALVSLGLITDTTS